MLERMEDFMDTETRKQIAWDSVWNLFQPCSSLGKRFKENQLPYLPADAAKWKEDQNDLKQLMVALQDTMISKQVQAALAPLDSIETLFQQVEAGAILQLQDAFKWKQWMWNGRELARVMAQIQLRIQTPDFLSWWPECQWDSMLGILNPWGKLEPTFVLDDAFDLGLRQIREQRRILQNQIDQARKQQDQELVQRYGRFPNREREYIWPREEGDRVQQANKDNDLVLQGETSWEIVFRASDRPYIHSLLGKLEQVIQQESESEKIVLGKLTRSLAVRIPLFRQCESAWGRLDWLVTRIVQGKQLGWNFPQLSEDWEMRKGAHPLLADSLRKKGKQLVPVSFSLGKGVSVLTGPNMGGKSVSLRTAGVLQALAQYGMPVPAEKFRFPLVDRIRFVGGDGQSIESGLSTFGGEMTRLTEILNNPVANSKGESKEEKLLLLLDEVGRGTNPQEGEALAVGITKYLHQRHWIVLLTTHYPGVAAVAAREGIPHWQIAGMSDHRIKIADHKCIVSEAFQIAEHYGLPEEALQESKKWLYKRDILRQNSAFKMTEQGKEASDE